MGYLLKEALKSICGVNQWSYAVFWKIGCQNPKLLIWEDCYYEVVPCSVLNQLGTHVGERVDLLVKKMMSNQVRVVGEGLIGRTAFTGNHQWLVSGHFNETIHPPEVINEVQLQFTSGMQTVAVVSALPHGVIQLGSSFTIMENNGFIDDVKSLILHLGSIPSALVSDNYIQDASTKRSRMPITQSASSFVDSCGDAKKLNYPAAFDGAMHTNIYQDIQPVNRASLSRSSKTGKLTASIFHLHNYNMSSEGKLGNAFQSSRNPEVDSGLALKGHLEDRVPRAEMIPFMQDSFPNCQTSYDPGDGFEPCTQHPVVSSSVLQPHLHGQFLEPYGGWTSGAHAVNCSNEDADGFLVVGDQPTSIGVTSGCFPEDDMCNFKYIPDKCGEKDLFEALNIALSKRRDHVPSIDFPTDFNKIHDASEVPSCETALYEINSFAQGDLFDVLGMNFRNKIINGYACKVSETAGENINNQMEPQDSTTVAYPNNCRIPGCDKFLKPGSDHLLDAMVSGAHSAAMQTSDDNVSCKTTLTKASCSSAPSSSLMFGQGSISQQMCELYGPSKTLLRSSETGTNLAVSSLGKNDTGNCSQSSSFYGSESSSWVEQGACVKHEASIATAISKKSGEVGKPARKRLKPGENPRPRPKDRQMIQDRVKELREMVPNGSKCSIDALLERTIKHMLFLQSVSQHADKLKHTVESKDLQNMNKDGGTLKDNFEGGATWAYEVGSQANVCPIVVEDLNAPRQLLVEMLCEERGFFLEIADIIRGMGLTILKGVMETRHDKIWARFAVEANRDVARVEVFLSLVHLLEQTGKIDTNPQKEDSNGVNRIGHSTFSTQAPYQEIT